MSSEKINNIIIQNFLDELSPDVPGAKISVLNLRRNVSVQGLLNEENVEKSAFIHIGDVESNQLKEKLVKELGSKNFIFLNFSGYLSAEIFSLLEGIYKTGWIDVNNSGNEAPDRITLSNENHLILVSERKFVESQYGNLNNLTTHVLDLEND